MNFESVSIKTGAATAVVLIILLALGAACGATPAEDLFRRGYEASTGRNWQEAIDWYTKAIKADPNNPEAYFQRAVNFEMTDRLQQATSDYQTALSIKPDMYLAMEYLAKIYEREGNYAAAVEIYTRAVPLLGDPRWKGIVRKWLADAKEMLRQSGGNPDRTQKSERKRPMF